MTIGPWAGYFPGIYGGNLTLLAPFVYRDNLTYVEALERLRQDIVVLSGQDEKLKAALLEALDGLRARLEDSERVQRAESEKLLGSFLQLRDHVSRLGPVGAVDCVVHGEERGVPYRVALGHVYDDDRVYGMFAKELDELALTAQGFDERAMTARRLDLCPDGALHIELEV